MTTNVRFSLAPEGSVLVLSGYVEPGGEIPTDVFMYENIGSGKSLGAYYGVCTLKEYYQLATWNNAPISMLNNKLVKFGILRRVIGQEEDPQAVEDKISKDLRAFKKAYLEGLDPQITTVSLD